MSQVSPRSESHGDEEQRDIPEIGMQVPMLRNAGDVQAPSPAPSATITPGPLKRAPSAIQKLPPGSYGLHGHGVLPQDRLNKAYYEKHPELLKKEQVVYQRDRPSDYSMSSNDLDKMVRASASRRSSFGTSCSPLMRGRGRGRGETWS